jgi:hypothetical protein
MRIATSQYQATMNQSLQINQERITITASRWPTATASSCRRTTRSTACACRA